MLAIKFRIDHSHTNVSSIPSTLPILPALEGRVRPTNCPSLSVHTGESLCEQDLPVVHLLCEMILGGKALIPVVVLTAGWGGGRW